MKTTIDINDTLLQEAKRLAMERNTTLRTVVETALRQWLSRERGLKRTPFRLRKASFRGNGLQPGLQEGDWTEIRSRVYEGRGG